jgi:hypothetical protein
LACGDGIQVQPEPPPPESDVIAEAAEEVEAPAVDPEAPTTTLEAPLEAWPLSFETAELTAIDDAAFAGDVLVVAGRRADQVVVLRYRRTLEAGVPKLVDAGKWQRVRADASKLVLVPRGTGLVAMWLADGHLEGVVVASLAELGEPVRLSGEEGGQLEAPMVAAGNGDELVACAKDKLGPICFGWDAELSLSGVNVIAKKTSVGEPRALITSDGEAGGFWLVLGNCKSQTCSRIDLAAVALDVHGAPGKRRDLPVVQVDRGTAFIPEGDGFVMVARRVAAGEHSAWRVSASATREIEGRFSRVIGGFAHGERTLLIERAHLKMRKGFPVRGYHVRPLTEGDKGRKKVEREAIPDAVADYLPTDADQDFAANRDALTFVAPPRLGRYAATIVRLGRQ